MDALILALGAMLLASADLYLVRRILHRGGGRVEPVVVAAALIALVVNSALVVAAGIVAGGQLGVGVLMLFQVFALVGAASALVWRDLAPASVTARFPAGGPVMPPGPRRLGPELAHFATFLFGDRAQFLLLSIAALAGTGAWAFLGAMGGLAASLAMLAWWWPRGGGAIVPPPPVPLTEPSWWWLARWSAAVILMAFAANRLVVAFGLTARWG